jgi:hypothetical protein
MTVETLLANAAFGDEPGRWPLPAAATPRARWLRAVAAGGQGRYAVALADLAQLSREADGPLLSLAYSTRASFLRQLGRHTEARSWDGRAVASAGTDAEARGDALIGLGADALGVGRFAASATALERVADLAAASPRLRVRYAWVSAELAMARGLGATAVRYAEHAVGYAEAFRSTRHTVKSSVVLAAAHCSAGDLKSARDVAEAALGQTHRFGMIPVRWALACLLTDIGSACYTTQEMAAIRDDCAVTVRQRGGVWSVR